MAASTTPPSSSGPSGPSGFWSWLRRSGDTPSRAATPAAALTPKQQRATHREQLFGVVRENMIRAGVLSSTYKFKVLTLDPAGQQFIVMVDWQPGAARTDSATNQTLELGLQQLARERLGFRVKAVYWRHTGGESPRASRSNPTSATPVTPATPEAAHVPAAMAASASPHDPHAVSEDELMAFRAALRSPAGAPAPVMADPRQGDAADFQPTVITDDAPTTDFGALSETQFGRLR